MSLSSPRKQAVLILSGDPLDCSSLPAEAFVANCGKRTSAELEGRRGVRWGEAVSRPLT